MNKLISIFVLSFGSIIYAPTIYAEDIQAAAGLRWRVFQTELTRVDNLVLLPTGELIATLELGHAEGQLVSIHNGQVTTLLEGLNRPDGLALAGNKLILTEEIRQGRVLQYDIDTRESKTLIYLDNPEGIVVLPGGSLLVTEDLHHGRLVRISPTRKLTVVTRDLSRPEGIRRGVDGTVYIAETGRGRILAYRDNKLRTIAEKLNEPDQLAIDKQGNIWIAEDADPGRILRIRNSKIEVMIRGLASPQGMVFDPRGRLYLAEQGRNRILLVTIQDHE